MFRKYSCDCIGLELVDDQGERHVWCVCPCDTQWDDPGVTLYERKGLLEKTSEPLPYEAVATLLRSIETLMAGGQSFRSLKEILNLPNPPEPQRPHLEDCGEG